MPRIICQSICHPLKEIGEVCGAKKARRAGMFCKDCENNAIRLLRPGSALSDDHRPQLQQLWNTHLVVDAANTTQKNKDNLKRRSNEKLKK